MSLFGFGKPNPATLQVKGDIAGLSVALKHRDAAVADSAARALLEMVLKPQYRALNAAALAAMRETASADTARRLAAFLETADPEASCWENSAVLEALVLLQRLDSLEKYFDRHAATQKRDGLFFLQLSGMLARYAAAQRDKRLLRKVLLAGPFGQPGVRVGTTAEDSIDPVFTATSAVVSTRESFARAVGEVFAALSTESELLELIAAQNGGDALTAAFSQLKKTGTISSLPALETFVATSSTRELKRTATETIVAIVSRLPGDALPALAQANRADFIRQAALLAICERGGPESLSVLIEAADSSNEQVSVAALQALQRLRAAEATSKLANIAQSKSGARANAAAAALAAIGTPDACQALLALPTERLAGTATLRELVARGHASAVVTRFTDALSRQGADDNMVVMAALRAAVPRPELASLQQALARPHVPELAAQNWGARNRAARALGAIGGDCSAEALELRLADEPDYELQQVLKDMIRDARR